MNMEAIEEVEAREIVPVVTAPAPAVVWDAERVQLLKDTVAKGASDSELSLFQHVCERTQLDPFLKQIHFVKRWDATLQREVGAHQVGIDGFRLIAQRSGQLDGQEGPFWCGEDGQWKDVWLSPKPPAAAMVKVYRKGCAHPFTGIARFGAYAQTKKDGSLNSMWLKMGDGQIAKCAEALGLRKAFPAELAGLYAHEEMAQADNAAPLDVEVRESAPAPSRPAPLAERPPAQPKPAGEAAPAQPVPDVWIDDKIPKDAMPITDRIVKMERKKRDGKADFFKVELANFGDGELCALWSLTGARVANKAMESKALCDFQISSKPSGKWNNYTIHEIVIRQAEAPGDDSTPTPEPESKPDDLPF
jgi:phage recombination protein Bet